MPRSSIAGLYGNSILVFWGTSILLSVVVALIYIPTNIVEMFLLPPHPLHHLFLFVLLMIAILARLRWNLNVVLICISFITRDVDHFFMRLLAIYSSLFENSLFSSFAHLFSGFFDLWEVSVFELPIYSGY
jgi:hypothetical protein